jgi:bile acid:Na+ symporter, BASS family
MQQHILTAVLALMVFSVALDLKKADFVYVLQRPVGVAVGLFAQFVLLPLATLGVTLLIDLPAPMEAAMILVACCPGGALSNVVTALGRGNLALSVSISAVSNVAALVLTPLNFAWMIAANPGTAAWAKAISADTSDMWKSLVFLLAIPTVLAMLMRANRPALADKLRKPLENLALAFLGIFILIAVATQIKQFVSVLALAMAVVIGHNALGLGLGWISSKLARLPTADARAVTVESGMQNAGLAVGIIATQFSADLQMTAIAGLWGIWHIVSGFTLTRIWRVEDSKEISHA